MPIIRIRVDGHIFKSVREMAKHLNVKYRSLTSYKLTHPSMTYEEMYWVYKEKARPIVIAGHVFNSGKELAKYLKVRPSTFYAYLKQNDGHYISAYYYFKDSKPRQGPHLDCVIDGMEFSSMKEIAEYLNVKPDTFIKYKFRNKCAVEEAYYYFKKKIIKKLNKE
jgi:DNA-binding CsgD family transcriptional regulator